LEKSLGDYENLTMPSAQRRFLMRELQKLGSGQAQFGTLAAEDLAALYVETQPEKAAAPGLRASSLPDVWQFTSADGRWIGLHRTDQLISRMRLAADSRNLPPDVRLNFFPPGQEAEGALFSQPAGPDFPGWRLGISLADQQIFQTASRQRVSAYLWIGVLVLATVLLLGSLALGLVRRQMTLTQLRNDLVANVTHELKTPLSSMRLLVETLLDTKTLNEKATREYLQLIARENSRLSRLIDNFLTFSRMERNKYAFGFTEVRPGEIVDAASAALRDRLTCAGCRFQVDVEPNLPSILADSDAMVTVLVNLLDNAMKYSGEEKQISLTAGAENGDVLFSVQDNGIGLAPRETKRIFQRFYRVDQPASRSGGGCGLGLSIVQFVVTAHLGTIRVQSQPGKGSEFVIQIPGIKAAVPEPSTAQVQ
jgi:signal transduction histidine kinase